ncbi:MAG: hypothetical protein U9N78_08210 [Actinomycetota bacterium]|nr:hypothetical protein [Actinomycetota bacterium]
MRRSVRWIVGVLVAVLLIPGMALASSSEQGSKTCVSGDVWIRSQATGTVRHYYPDSSLRATFVNGYLLRDRYSDTNDDSTTWKVSTTDYLDYADTYAYCHI